MDLGLAEILVIATLALLFFGPKRLPASIKSVKDAIRGFKKGLSGTEDSADKPDSKPIVTPTYQPKPAPQLSHTQIIDAEVEPATQDPLKTPNKTPQQES